jgi:hypothetical protein
MHARMTVCYFKKNIVAWKHVQHVVSLGGNHQILVIMTRLVVLLERRSVFHINPTVFPTYSLTTKIIYDRDNNIIYAVA